MSKYCWSILVLVFLGHTGYAEPIIINLLLQNNKEDKIELPLETAELSPVIKAMLHDMGSITKEMRTDKKKHFVDVPIYYKISKRTLEAATNALNAMRNLQKSHKEMTFSKLKTIVKDFCFPQKDRPKPKDYLDLMLASNFLDIGDLLSPVAAVFIDMFVKEVPKEQLKKQIAEQIKDVPEDLRPLFDEYLDWLRNPGLVVKRFTVPVKARPFSKMTIAENKLYGANETNLTVIDLATDRVTEGTALNITGVRAMAAAGKKLYLLKDRTVVIFDPATNKVTGAAIPVSILSKDLVVVGGNLYVANWRGGDTVSVIDTATDTIIGEPIAVGHRPYAFAVADKKLYVLNETNISVIDTSSNRVISDPIKLPEQEGTLAIVAVAQKVYVMYKEPATQITISVMDIATNQVIGKPIHDDYSTLAAMGKTLCIYTGSGISLIDSVMNRPIGITKGTEPLSHYDRAAKEDLVFDYYPQVFSFAVSGSKLYASRKDWLDIFDFERFLYYSK